MTTAAFAIATLNLAVSGGDTISLVNGATGVVRWPDNSQHAVNVTVTEATGIGLNVADVALQEGFNVLAIRAPSGHAMVLTDTQTGTSVRVGTLEVGVEVLSDGTVIAPTQFNVKVPTQGTLPQADRALVLSGLPGPDWTRAIVVPNTGGLSSKTVQASATGTATLRDAAGGLSANDIDGPNSTIGVYFARNKDLLPDAPVF